MKQGNQRNLVIIGMTLFYTSDRIFLGMGEKKASRGETNATAHGKRRE